MTSDDFLKTLSSPVDWLIFVSAAAGGAQIEYIYDFLAGDQIGPETAAWGVGVFTVALKRIIWDNGILKRRARIRTAIDSKEKIKIAKDAAKMNLRSYERYAQNMQDLGAIMLAAEYRNQLESASSVATIELINTRTVEALGALSQTDLPEFPG